MELVTNYLIFIILAVVLLLLSFAYPDGEEVDKIPDSAQGRIRKIIRGPHSTFYHIEFFDGTRNIIGTSERYRHTNYHYSINDLVNIKYAILANGKAWVWICDESLVPITCNNRVIRYGMRSVACACIITYIILGSVV